MWVVYLAGLIALGAALAALLALVVRLSPTVLALAPTLAFAAVVALASTGRAQCDSYATLIVGVVLAALFALGPPIAFLAQGRRGAALAYVVPAVPVGAMGYVFGVLWVAASGGCFE